MVLSTDKTNKKTEFEQVVELVEQLRSPQGCAWDRKQTLESLKEHITEEAEEVIEAIKNKDAENLKEELGDVIWVAIMLVQIAKDEGLFDVNDVLSNTREKIIRRHPHVFGDVKTEDVKEILTMWDEIKAKEKADKAAKQHAEQHAKGNSGKK